jgi:hypothetical protein
MTSAIYRCEKCGADYFTQYAYSRFCSKCDPNLPKVVMKVHGTYNTKTGEFTETREHRCKICDHWQGECNCDCFMPYECCIPYSELKEDKK